MLDFPLIRVYTEYRQFDNCYMFLANFPKEKDAKLWCLTGYARMTDRLQATMLAAGLFFGCDRKKVSDERTSSECV